MPTNSRDRIRFSGYKHIMNPKASRRDFLKNASVLSAGMAAGGLGFSATAAESPKKTNGHPIKISLNAYCFSKSLTAPEAGGKAEMTYFDVLEFCAKNNFDAIDPTGYYFPGYPKVPSDSY